MYKFSWSSKHPKWTLMSTLSLNGCKSWMSSVSRMPTMSSSFSRRWLTPLNSISVPAYLEYITFFPICGYKTRYCQYHLPKCEFSVTMHTYRYLVISENVNLILHTTICTYVKHCKNSEASWRWWWYVETGKRRKEIEIYILEND